MNNLQKNINEIEIKISGKILKSSEKNMNKFNKWKSITEENFENVEENYKKIMLN